MTTYDQTPYEGHFYSETSLDHIARIAQSMNWQPPLIAEAQVLELGCGDGSNLIGLAAQFTSTEFFGIDFSSVQIQMAEKSARDRKLSNIKFAQADLNTWKPSEKYSYILCHGVYSWVSVSIQNKILEITRDFLTENGIAFVSFNVLPGWHLRTYIRDVLIWMNKDLNNPGSSLEDGKTFLNAIAQDMLQKNRKYAGYFAYELDLIKDKSSNYLVHEYLEPENKAFYFSDFVKEIKRFNLRYIGDARINGYQKNEFSGHLAQVLEQKKDDPLWVEQTLDLIRNRSFRRALIGKA